MFTSSKAERVFEHYNFRHQKELAEMQQLGSLGLARRDQFLLPIGEAVGWFLHSLILAKKPKRVLEVGTSYGYSTLFLADAVSQLNAELITLEVVDYKQDYAREQMNKAGLAGCIDFRLGDAIESIDQDVGTFDFVLIDIWKELYVPAMKALLGKLSDEAILAADNMYDPIMHLDSAREYRRFLNSQGNIQTTLLPIGAGIELSCFWPEGSDKL